MPRNRSVPTVKLEIEMRHFHQIHHGGEIHWASNETYYFTKSENSLKSKALTWIIFGHRLGTFILNISTSRKNPPKVNFNQRGDRCDEITRGQFSKITETACLSGWKFEADKSRYGVYGTPHCWNWMNSYWMFWIGCLRGAHSELARWAVSAIFEKWPFVI